MNEEINGLICEMCVRNLALPEQVNGMVYLCGECYDHFFAYYVLEQIQVKRIMDTEAQKEPTTAICKMEGCNNPTHKYNVSLLKEYCPTHFRALEKEADSWRCEMTANRIAGLNDDGSMTKNIGSNNDIDYGRKDGE